MKQELDNCYFELARKVAHQIADKVVALDTITDECGRNASAVTLNVLENILILQGIINNNLVKGMDDVSGDQRKQFEALITKHATKLYNHDDMVELGS